MSNFERIKNCETEYEMADIICTYMFNNIQKMKASDVGYTSLPFLRWLQSDRNVFDEETPEQ